MRKVQPFVGRAFITMGGKGGDETVTWSFCIWLYVLNLTIMLYFSTKHDLLFCW
jgi:hypothetical protein